LQHPEKVAEVCLLIFLHYVPKELALTDEQQSKVKNYFDFRITEAVNIGRGGKRYGELDGADVLDRGRAL
jgi:hypothetical protein